MKDVCPKSTDDGGYEEFDQLVERVNSWLKDQVDIRMLNIQSVLVQKKPGINCEN
jgi:hypothetical protein